MKNLTEPYIKEKNLLQLPMFYFGKGRPEKTVVEWTDSKGDYKLECVCKHGVPGSAEQDVYAACMRLWVKKGMPRELTLNYSSICRELNLDPVCSTSRIKKSLERLVQARYEFIQCFLVKLEDGTEKIATHFSLFDSADLFKSRKGVSRRNSKSVLFFPDKIRDNLERKYYQYLDLYWYKQFPEGLARRLYEYLEKRRYHGVDNVFSISEESICRWLPILDKHTTNRRKRLAKIANALIESSYLSEYSFNKKNCVCRFTYSKPKDLSRYEPEIEEKNLSCSKDNKIKMREISEWLDSIPYFHKKRKQEILSMGKSIELYQGIRLKYEEKATLGKPLKVGWIYKAFIEGWQFSEQVEKQKNEYEAQKKRETIKSKKKVVLNFIDEKSCLGTLFYKGEKFRVLDDYGLELIEPGVLEVWADVKLDKFEIVE